MLREKNARRVVATDNAKHGDFIGLPPRQHGAVAAEERHAQVWLSELRLLQALLYLSSFLCYVLFSHVFPVSGLDVTASIH